MTSKVIIKAEIPEGKKVVVNLSNKHGMVITSDSLKHDEEFTLFVADGERIGMVETNKVKE